MKIYASFIDSCCCLCIGFPPCTTTCSPRRTRRPPPRISPALLSSSNHSIPLIIRSPAPVHAARVHGALVRSSLVLPCLALGDVADRAANRRARLTEPLSGNRRNSRNLSSGKLHSVAPLQLHHCHITRSTKISLLLRQNQCHHFLRNMKE